MLESEESNLEEDMKNFYNFAVYNQQGTYKE